MQRRIMVEPMQPIAFRLRTFRIGHCYQKTAAGLEQRSDFLQSLGGIADMLEHMPDGDAIVAASFEIHVQQISNVNPNTAGRACRTLGRSFGAFYGKAALLELKEKAAIAASDVKHPAARAKPLRRLARTAALE